MVETKDSREKEKQMVRLLQENNQHALAQIYDAYSPVFMGLISRLLKDQETREKVLQKTFYNIWKQRLTYDPDKMRFLTWMIVLAKETALAALKMSPEQQISVCQENATFNNRKTDLRLSEMSGSEGEDPFGVLFRNEFTALDLIYLKGYSYQEAAETLGIPVPVLMLDLKMAINKIAGKTKS